MNISAKKSFIKDGWYGPNPAGNYLLKVNNRNTRKRCEICSKLTIKTPERRHWRWHSLPWAGKFDRPKCIVTAFPPIEQVQCQAHRLLEKVFFKLSIGVGDDDDDDYELFLWYGWPTKGVSPYFQPGPLSEILIANLQHNASRFWTCAELEFRLRWMKLCSSDISKVMVVSSKGCP